MSATVLGVTKQGTKLRLPLRPRRSAEGWACMAQSMVFGVAIDAQPEIGRWRAVVQEQVLLGL